MDFPNSERDFKERDEKGRATLIANSNECNGELKVGMKVYSEDEAYNLYNEYALIKGFSIRKGNKRRALSGSVRQREYLCSKAGHREFEDLGEVRKFNHLETRTGCNAKIRFTVENDTWIISHLNDDHNHEFATPEERGNLRSGRSILKARGDVISSMVAVGIKPTKSCSFLTKEVGVDNVGFTKRDCYSFLHTEGEKMIEAEDGQSVINFFRRKQVEDPMFFYSMQVDQNNRIANFFWRDGRSKLDYDSFGDVVIFDTTYRTNKHNLICAPFVGINHHWKSTLFGCAFLSDETTESFIWLFETFLEAMGYQQPKSIFTDEDQAMENAIEAVFTESRHRLCLWHISNNAKQHLASCFTNVEFKGLFNKSLHERQNEMEFESNWASMIKRFGLENHSWLKRLYDHKSKWCPAFSVDIFSARMKSTQRREIANSVFHQILLKPIPLIQVIHYYEEKVKEMRRNEFTDDFRRKNGAPTKANNRGILRHASDVYTFFMFKMFEEELMDSIGLNCDEVGCSGTSSIYKLLEDGHERVYTVEFNPSMNIVSCSCKLFETLGLLCQHALRVLVVKNVREIPTRYILKRWTKSAKLGMVCDFGGSLHKEENSAHSLCLSELNHIGHNLFDKGSITRKCTNIVKDKLMEALKLVEREIANLNGVEDPSNLVDESIQDVSSDANEVPCLIDEIHVLDPVCGWKERVDKCQDEKPMRKSERSGH